MEIAKEIKEIKKKLDDIEEMVTSMYSLMVAVNTGDVDLGK